MALEQKSVATPVLYDGHLFEDKSVCVCVCVRERERERANNAIKFV